MLVNVFTDVNPLKKPSRRRRGRGIISLPGGNS